MKPTNHMTCEGQVSCAGSSALGGALMLLFFATIGAAAGSASAVAMTGWLAAFIAVQLGTHLLVLMGGARLLKLPIRVI